MSFDPKIVPIQGDLSRADVVELSKLCSGKRVVEFGMGGSTLILSRCAASLTSYETDSQWHWITNHRIEQIPDKSCQPALIHNSGVPDNIPECDVLFVDGLSSLRDTWVCKFWKKARESIVIHDGRRITTWQSVRELLKDEEAGNWLDRIEFNLGKSNLLVLVKRQSPLVYENWNIVEAGDARVPVSHHNFIADMPPYPASWLDMDMRNSPRLKNYRNGFVAGAEASAAVRKLLTSGKPVSVVVLGDGEAAWWAFDEIAVIPSVKREWLRSLAMTSGFDIDEDRKSLLDGFDEAARNAQLMPIQYMWTTAEMLCLETLERKNWDMSRPKIDCNAIYRMNEYLDFFPILEGRKILIVGGHAQRQAAIMGAKEFQKAHLKFGCIGGYEIVGAIQTPSRLQRPKTPFLHKILSAITKVQFDLALVSAGGMAFHICEHIRRMGKIGFDAGSLDRLILGERKKPSTFQVPEDNAVAAEGIGL